MIRWDEHTGDRRLVHACVESVKVILRHPLNVLVQSKIQHLTEITDNLLSSVLKP
jgi:hypothetical protein